MNGRRNCRARVGGLAIAIFAMGATALPMAVQAGKWTTFDPPGSYATLPTATANGLITGYYEDLSGARHGFVRDAQGGITAFDVLPPTPGVLQFTVPLSINKAGTSAGFYTGADANFHAFTRDAQGQLSTIDPPGALWSQAIAINAAGIIAGVYGIDMKYVHGFVRNASGGYTSFDVGPNTYVSGLDSQGNIGGWVRDAKGNTSGFVRDAAGMVTSFLAFNGQTAVAGIDSGVVAGTWIDSTWTPHGYLRGVDGNITSIDPTGAASTYATGIKSNTVVGYMVDGAGLRHGFERTPQGTIKTFDVGGTGVNATLPAAIGARKSVVGNYLDSSGLAHGFTGRP